MSTDSIDIVYRALIAGQLDDADLSARRIGKLLGKTTSIVYHHFGSLDGFLFAVSQRGYRDLRGKLDEAYAERGDFGDVAAAFVEFGLDHPELYPLMFERRFDWDRLRADGAFEEMTPSGEMLMALACLLEAAKSPDPAADMRLLVSGLHGLVSLAASGRMNVGELTTPDRAVAISAARDLVNRLIPKE